MSSLQYPEFLRIFGIFFSSCCTHYSCFLCLLKVFIDFVGSVGCQDMVDSEGQSVASTSLGDDDYGDEM